MSDPTYASVSNAEGKELYVYFVLRHSFNELGFEQNVPFLEWKSGLTGDCEGVVELAEQVDCLDLG